MQFRRYSDSKSFYKAVLPLLLQNEAENNLMLSILISLLKKPNSYQNLYLAALVNSQGEIIQAAMMTPPHNLLLTQTSEDFISHIILNALEESIPIPGVLGPNTSGLEFSVFMRSKAGKNFILREPKGLSN